MDSKVCRDLPLKFLLRETESDQIFWMLRYNLCPLGVLLLQISCYMGATELARHCLRLTNAHHSFCPMILVSSLSSPEEISFQQSHEKVSCGGHPDIASACYAF